MNFAEAEKFLLGRRRLGVKLGLRNMREAMTLLGHPEEGFRAVHVAGSKGKGSLCALLESVLVAARLPVGLYTSPHLVSVRERIRIGGRPVGPAAFAGLVERMRAVLGPDGPPLTYFEWLTAMAFLHFAKKKVPLAIVETGLGGRLDATNVLPASLPVITSIEREHTEFLGPTLGEIAEEKGGIVKKGATMISGVMSPTARRSLAAAARARKASVRWLDREASWTIRDHTLKGLSMDLRIGGESMEGLRVGLVGRHQAGNAALAVLTALELRSRGWLVGDDAIRQGLASVSWPGRCDFKPGCPDYLVDGSHTPASVRALAATLDELAGSRRRILLFGALKDKRVRLLAEPLLERAVAAVVVKAPEERGAEPSMVLRLLSPRFRRKCITAGGVAEGMGRAESAAGKGGLVVAAGSLFLAGEVLRLLPGRSSKGRGGKRSP